jgi:hypothetical protein
VSSARLAYQVVTRTRRGTERLHAYAPDDALRPGDVLFLGGRYWLIQEVGDGRALAEPARYRLVLRYPDGRREPGGFRRFRPDAPQVGHAFTTLENGQPIGWSVVDQRLERDEQGKPYLELIAERDYTEAEELPDHELEHALSPSADTLPESGQALLARAEEAGLAVELVALDPGEEPDWEAARRFIDSLVLEEVEGDLIELCGVDPSRDAREKWLPTVQERLRDDLFRFRADIEGDRDQIEEWDFLGGRVFASVGSGDDESDPDKGHGWMCRLVDAEALGAAGFERVRKAQLIG